MTPASLVEMLAEEVPLAGAVPLDPATLTTPRDTITPDGLDRPARATTASGDSPLLPFPELGPPEVPPEPRPLELELELELDPEPLVPSPPLADLLPFVGMTISAGLRPAAAKAINIGAGVGGVPR